MSNNTYNLPTLSNEGGLAAYLAQIKKFPMLDAEEEYMLAKNWKTTGNVKSAEKLVTSHLRLVAKIAMGYKGYGLPLNEMISEGNVGLMQAVKKFEPEKGFRLATYAMWWIKASIQEYILRSWSLVKIGTTTAQKKLFFNLKKLKNQIAPNTEGDLRNEDVKNIAESLDVSEEYTKPPLRYNEAGLIRYLEKNGMPKTVNDLNKHKFISFGKGAPSPVYNPDWALKIGMKDNKKRKPIMKVNSVMGLLLAVESGVGLAALPDYLVFQSKNLLKVLPKCEGPITEAHFVYPQSLKNVARVQAFRNFLYSKISEWEF